MTHSDISDAEIRAVRDSLEKSLGMPLNTVGFSSIARAAILTSRAACLAEGKKVVAREPTEEMIDAGDDICPIARGTESHRISGGKVPEDYWRAMWDAAP